jgi:hypothetical protein
MQPKVSRIALETRILSLSVTCTIVLVSTTDEEYSQVAGYCGVGAVQVDLSLKET